MDSIINAANNNASDLPFDELFDELLVLIVTPLIPETFALLSQVSKRLRQIASDERIWKQKFQSSFPNQLENPLTYPSWKMRYLTSYCKLSPLHSSSKRHLLSLVKENHLSAIQNGFENGLFQFTDLWLNEMTSFTTVNEIVRYAQHHAFSPILDYFYKLARAFYIEQAHIENTKITEVYDPQGLTIYHWAVACWQLEAVKKFVISGCRFFNSSDNGDIDWAASNNAHEILAYLLNLIDNETNHYTKQILKPFKQDLSYENINVLEKHGVKHMSLPCKIQYYQAAAKVGHLDVIQHLIAEADVSPYGPLHYLAAEAGQLEVIRALFASGKFNIDQPKSDKPEDQHYTVLYAAALNGHLDLVSYLTDSIAEVKLLIFCAAAMNGHLHVLKMMVEKFNIKADFLSRQTATGNTILSVSCQRGHRDVVAYLLQLGAEISSDDKNLSPLHKACHFGYHQIAGLLLPYVDINILNSNNTSSLFMAAQNGHTKCVKLLIENKADVKILRCHKFSPLYVAVVKNHLDIVKLLAPLGMINHPTPDGKTPFYSAAEAGCLAIMETLHTHGADISLADHNGYRPIHIAAAKCNLQCVKWLLKHGASVDIYVELVKPEASDAARQIALLLALKLKIEVLEEKIAAQSSQIFSVFNDVYALKQSKDTYAVYQHILDELIEDKMSVQFTEEESIQEILESLINHYMDQKNRLLP